VRISPRGGVEPVWSKSSRELYYLEGARMMAVSFEAGEEFNFKPPALLSSSIGIPERVSPVVRRRCRRPFPDYEAKGDHASRHHRDHELGAERRQGEVTQVGTGRSTASLEQSAAARLCERCLPVGGCDSSTSRT
jgi:hypothetical protein